MASISTPTGISSEVYRATTSGCVSRESNTEEIIGELCSEVRNVTQSAMSTESKRESLSALQNRSDRELISVVIPDFPIPEPSGSGYTTLNRYLQGYAGSNASMNTYLSRDPIGISFDLLTGRISAYDFVMNNFTPLGLSQSDFSRFQSDHPLSQVRNVSETVVQSYPGYDTQKVK